MQGGNAWPRPAGFDATEVTLRNAGTQGQLHLAEPAWRRNWRNGEPVVAVGRVG
jgi:hypothetical protein